jgi:adenylate kinase family enzyme
VKEFGLTQLGTGNIFREYLGALKKLERQPEPEQFWDAKADWFVDDGKIRVAIKADSSKAGVPIDDAVLGLKAARFVNRGLFVPDRITNDLFAAAFAKLGHSGAILDGYPRTTDQSKFLMDLLKKAGKRLDLVLVVDGDDADISAARSAAGSARRRSAGRSSTSSSSRRATASSARPAAPRSSCAATTARRRSAAASASSRRRRSRPSTGSPRRA